MLREGRGTRDGIGTSDEEAVVEGVFTETRQPYVGLKETRPPTLFPKKLDLKERGMDASVSEGNVGQEGVGDD